MKRIFIGFSVVFMLFPFAFGGCIRYDPPDAVSTGVFPSDTVAVTQANTPADRYTVNEARTILEDTLERASKINPYLELPCDFDSPMPGNEEYHLVAEEAQCSIDDIKAVVLSVFTDECAEREIFPELLYATLDEWKPVYIVRDGLLYIYEFKAARGSTYDGVARLETLRIVAQGENYLWLEADETAIGDSYRTASYYLTKVDGVWRFAQNDWDVIRFHN